MKTVEKSVHIWYSAAEMYRLVTDVKAYPQFLPWCDHADILEHGDNSMLAEVGIAFAGIHQRFQTRNTHESDRRVSMQLVNGPFSSLDGDWLFEPLGGQRACRVSLTLRYGFSGVLGAAISPVFDRIANTIVEAFVQRAAEVYGD